jgi:hypothetical protein
LKQYTEATSDGKSVFENKEHLGIHWNLDVPNLDDYMHTVDTLQLVYVLDSTSTIERDKQDWRVLDLMFINNLEEL